MYKQEKHCYTYLTSTLFPTAFHLPEVNPLQAPKKKRKTLKVIGIILLAVICIGGTELLVCRFAAPELYHTITAPVVQLAQRIIASGKALFPVPATADPTPTPVNQAVSEPVESAPSPVEDPTITEFITDDGVELLTGGVVEMVYYNQGESPWADLPYGPDNIGGYGCGPTSMAMLISSLCGITLTPEESAQQAYEEGHCAPGNGSYLSIVEGMAADYGLEVEGFSGDITASELSLQLATGHIYIALMGPGHFTARGHFIVLRGLTLEGKVLVADPNSRERSLVAWDPQLILDELSASRWNGAPLWCFSSLPAPVQSTP